MVRQGRTLEGVSNVGEIEHYEIMPGGGPSGVALAMMVAAFWDEYLEARLRFRLEYPHNQSASSLRAPKRIDADITGLRRLEQVDGSAGKAVFLWGTCHLEVQEDGQEREFFAVYRPDSHWGWMDIGPKLADNYGQEVVDKYKSTYASDN